MKKLLFLYSLIFLFSACIDDAFQPNIPIGTVTATVEGTTINLTNGTSAITFELNDRRRFTIATGTVFVDPPSGASIVLAFSVPLDEDLEVKSYSFPGTNCLSSAATEVCGFTSLSTNTMIEEERYRSTFVGSSLNVNITDVDFRSQGFIKGTFTGMVKNPSTGNIVPLTEGKFNVRIE